MKLNAYVLAGDPAWAPQSIRSYYHLIDRLVVCYDADGLSWSGSPLQVDETLPAMLSADPDNKIVLMPGHFSHPDQPPMVCETAQRQAAADAASEGCDWVIQLDADEIMLSPATFAHFVEVADGHGAQGLEFPLRDFYQGLGDGRFLEHCGRWWNDRAAYPGPTAIRAGSTFSWARQTNAALYRVDLCWRNTDPWHASDSLVHAVIGRDEAIAHMSWVRTEAEMQAKSQTSGHAQERNWQRELRRWRGRQAHPLRTTVATPLRRDAADQFRITHVDISRER